MGWFKFWWLCIRRSMRLSLEAADTVLLVILILIGAIGAMTDYEIIINAPFWIQGSVVIAVIFLTRILLIAPYQLYCRISKKENLLKERLCPKLRLSLPNDGGVKRISFGLSHESPFTKSRQTVETGSTTVVYVMCNNISQKAIQKCTASLICVKELLNDGSVEETRFSEPVQLLWSRSIESKEYSATIPPGVPQPIYLFFKHPKNLLYIYRKTNELPLEYHQIFDSNKNYRIWIQADGNDAVPDRICLDIFFEKDSDAVRLEDKCFVANI